MDLEQSSGEFSQGDQTETSVKLEQVSVVDENNPNAAPRVAKLIPVPGNSNSFYLSYDGVIKESDPIYTFPTKHAQSATKKRKVTTSPSSLKGAATPGFSKTTTQKQGTSKSSLTDKKKTVLKDDEPETLNATNKLVEINQLQDCTQSDDLGMLPLKVEPSDADISGVMLEDDEDEIEGDEDFFDDPGEEIEVDSTNIIGMEEDDEEEPYGELTDNLKAKIDQVAENSKATRKAYLAATGGYRFSGSWKKAPKQEKLMKTRMDVLQEILNDYKSTCKICFEGEHGEDESCPLLNPIDIIYNKDDCEIRFKMPDEVVFGVSRIYSGQDSLFARDEIPAYTQFGPIEGRIVSMQDLASMGIVKNEIDVANLWPFPIENGQHEFDFQYFLDTQDLSYSNWLKFIKVESPKEEHPPYNIQTVYHGKLIYFVTTKEIEPGGELFLRPFEPPQRVFYNMHRLGEVFFNYCPRVKCKMGEVDHLDLKNVLYFVRHQKLVHCQDTGSFSWAAIYNCNLCGEDCFDKLNYKQHMLDRHSTKQSDDRNVNKCRFCNKLYKTKNGLYHHIRLQHPDGEKKSVCSICGKTFKHPIFMRQHYNLAHKEDPQNCEICNKAFKNATRLRIHKFKVHRSADKYKQCAVCGAQFKLAWNLTVHMKKHEREQAARITSKKTVIKVDGTPFVQDGKYQCDMIDCGGIYDSRNELQVHYEEYHQVTEDIMPLILPQ